MSSCVDLDYPLLMASCLQQYGSHWVVLILVFIYLGSTVFVLNNGYFNVDLKYLMDMASCLWKHGLNCVHLEQWLFKCGTRTTDRTSCLQQQTCWCSYVCGLEQKTYLSQPRIEAVQHWVCWVCGHWVCKGVCGGWGGCWVVGHQTCLVGVGAFRCVCVCH